MKVTGISVVVGALGTVTEGLVQGLEDVEIRWRVETIKTTVKNSSEKHSANAGEKNFCDDNNNNNNNNNKEKKRNRFLRRKRQLENKFCKRNLIKGKDVNLSVSESIVFCVVI